MTDTSSRGAQGDKRRGAQGDKRRGAQGDERRGAERDERTVGPVVMLAGLVAAILAVFLFAGFAVLPLMSILGLGNSTTLEVEPSDGTPQELTASLPPTDGDIEIVFSQPDGVKYSQGAVVITPVSVPADGTIIQSGCTGGCSISFRFAPDYAGGAVVITYEAGDSDYVDEIQLSN